MNHTSSLLTRLLRAALVLGALLLVASACSSDDPIALDPEAARQFDIANNLIADLTPANGAEDVPRDELRLAALAADQAGTELRIVVAAPDGEFVPAKAVVDRYGGTAISYQADRTAFEGASNDISAAQLNRAIDAAKVEVAIGDSATAFVGVLTAEGLEGRGALTRWILLGLLIPAAVFMIWGAWSYLTARKRREKRDREFVERRKVLTDWAGLLGPEVEALKPMAAAADDSAKQTWHEASTFVSTITDKLAEARNPGDLDAAEMRIGRVAIKLRELRNTLEG